MKKPRSRNAYKYDEAAIQRLRDSFASLSEDDQDDELFDSNDKEVYWAFHLVRAGLIEPNVFCSPDWLQEIQERFRDLDGTPSLVSELVGHLSIADYETTKVVEQPESNFALPPIMKEAMEYLEQQWKKLDDISNENFNWRVSENDIPNFRNLTPVHAFLQSIWFGRYPTPEIVLAVAKSFDLYLTAAGELSLEEVFFGRPKKRAGNFASRSLKELRYLFFHDTLLRERAWTGSGKTTVTELAEKFLTYEFMDEDGNVGHFDTETFLRGYRRWRKSSGLADEDDA